MVLPVLGRYYVSLDTWETFSIIQGWRLVEEPYKTDNFVPFRGPLFKDGKGTYLIGKQCYKMTPIFNHLKLTKQNFNVLKMHLCNQWEMALPLNELYGSLWEYVWADFKVKSAHMGQ